MKGLKYVLFWMMSLTGIVLWTKGALANGHNPVFWYLSTFGFIVLYGIWIAWMKGDSTTIEMGCHSSSQDYSHYQSLQYINNSSAHINL